MYCDPCARRLWNSVFEEKAYGLGEKAKHTLVLLTDDRSDGGLSDGGKDLDDEEGYLNDVPDDEFTTFEKALAGKVKVGNTLEIFLKTLNEYDPLQFWKADKQNLFPLHFWANTFTLTFGSTSIIQESVFSSCGDTLTQRRKRLVDNPDLLEAVAMLRFVISTENKNKDLLVMKQQLKALAQDKDSSSF